MMPPELDVEEDYASSEDSDFAPEEGGRRDDSADESEDSEIETGKEAATATATKRKRQPVGGEEAEDAGFENSGDEAIIEKGKKRRRKTKDKGGDVANAEEGGEGGLIKTRSQRALEKTERKTAAVTGPVTVDVNALWAQMTAAPSKTSSTTSQKQPTDSVPEADAAGPAKESNARSSTGGDPSQQMIKIKRTYNFAGKVHTEEKLVARDSAEAKLYLESLGESVGPNAAAAADEDSQPKKQPRKAFRSAFEPIFDIQLSHRTDLNLGMAARLKAREDAAGAGAAAKKLTTVEMSRMDWAGFVDKEGIKDELLLAGRSKQSYAERQGFLARSEARREEDARKARMATKV